MRQIILPLVLLALFTGCKNDQKTPEPTPTPMVKTASTTIAEKPMPSEFADPRYTDMGKAMMKKFADGDIDAYAENLTDNAVYAFSGGDSLAGKKAIVAYWKDRRANVVQSIQMSNDIWLPIKVNVPQQGPDMKGVWMISWHQVSAKYRNGKALKFWTHQDMHYNDADKVDRIIMYMDRAPINAALGIK